MTSRNKRTILISNLEALQLKFIDSVASDNLSFVKGYVEGSLSKIESKLVINTRDGLGRVPIHYAVFNSKSGIGLICRFEESHGLFVEARV